MAQEKNNNSFTHHDWSSTDVLLEMGIERGKLPLEKRKKIFCVCILKMILICSFINSFWYAKLFWNKIDLHCWNKCMPTKKQNKKKKRFKKLNYRMLFKLMLFL